MNREPASRVFRVLIVDDSAMDRRFYRGLLAKSGMDCEVSECSDAESALGLIHREPPDCVLLDHHLPGMNGVALLRILGRSSERLRVPAIMMTGLADESLAHQALRAGAQALLAKGCVTEKGLVDAIRMASRSGAPPELELLEAEYQYASAAYAGREVQPTLRELGRFAIAGQLQRLARAFEKRSNPTLPPPSLRALGVV